MGQFDAEVQDIRQVATRWTAAVEAGNIEQLGQLMQMAMVLTSQKPIQRNRQGEVPEGLPGSTLERGMRERKRRELGRSFRFLIRQK